MSFRHWIPFFHQYIRNPEQVGAVAPSSRKLAAALLDPLTRRTDPSRVLEIGAGTGAITRQFEHVIGPQDRLDICEIRSDFVTILKRDVLGSPNLSRAVAEERLEVHCCPAQEIDRPNTYDFVISGLPFNAFDYATVEVILKSIAGNLAPGGVFSYFEYLFLGALGRTFASRKSRLRMREVTSFMKAYIDQYEIQRDYVLFNLPPASARHWRWTQSVDQPERGSPYATSDLTNKANEPIATH